MLKKIDMKTISFLPNENKGPVVVLKNRRDTGDFESNIFILSPKYSSWKNLLNK